MHERTLRTVLLVQAIEQSDRNGELLPLADRAEATRTAARDDAKLRAALTGPTDSQAASGPKTIERYLAARAERLREQLEMRSPVIRHVLALAGGASWVSRAFAIAALILGLSLSALDGSRRINILAFPLIGLILWNVVVYILLGLEHLRRRPARPAGTSGLSHFYDRYLRWRAAGLLRSSSKFNAPLTAGLKRFATEWGTVAPRLVVLRAKRLFHVCAALVALGLIVGIYVRGIGLRYDAGWESTFLGPGQVRMLLHVLYGPASALSGISLPASDDAINALKWNGAAGGEEAADWIHLLALTAFIAIIVPRVFAALAANVSLAWYSRRVPAPPSLIPYARETLAEVGETVQQVASITPYSYAPDTASLQGLDRLLAVALGGAVTIDLREPVNYGDEDSYGDRQPRAGLPTASWNVLMMSMASTPEAENHGAIVTRIRDSLQRSASAVPWVVIVDEAPFVARMGGDASLRQRVEDRRALWRSFVAGYGLQACLIDLSRFSTPESVTDADRESVRDSLWTARDRAVS